MGNGEFVQCSQKGPKDTMASDGSSQIRSLFKYSNSLGVLVPRCGAAVRTDENPLLWPDRELPQ